VRGLDVRHGRGLAGGPEHAETSGAGVQQVTENSHGLHPDVTPGCETQRV
jgi:hypothetical protein